jgi:hypothetical protein
MLREIPLKRISYRGIWMIDDKDISNSYILYFVAVVAIIGLLLLGAVLLASLMCGRDTS